MSDAARTGIQDTGHVTASDVAGVVLARLRPRTQDQAAAASATTPTRPVHGDPQVNTCIHAGCIPSGALHQAMSVKAEALAAAQAGVQVHDVVVDWGRMLAWVSSVVTRVSAISDFALQVAQVEVLHGPARLTGQGQVGVAGQVFDGPRS